VVEEIVNGSVSHTYTYGHDLISQDQVDPATNSWHATFYAYDGRGTVRFLTNESGQVTDTYVYDAFGTLITATGSTNNRYLYSGEQFDPTLGLYYLRARLMNPLTGRFSSADSYPGDEEDPMSLHKYLYAACSPTNGIDTSGRMTIQEEEEVSAEEGILSGMAETSVTVARLKEEEMLVAALITTAASIGHLVNEAGEIERSVYTDLQGSQPIVIWRGVDADKATRPDGLHYRKPKLSPSSFRVDADGVSTFEFPDVTNHPYLVGFAVVGVTQQQRRPGASGQILGVPLGTLGTFTPQLSPFPDKHLHWSINNRADAQLNVTLSTYAKTFKQGVVIPNPLYRPGAGEPTIVDPVD
jgi:RHS repeat-associated protein